jgi:hypothetical protein
MKMKTTLLAMIIAFSFATGKYSSQINYHQRQMESHQKKVIYHQTKVNYHQKKYNDYTMKQAKEMSKK